MRRATITSNPPTGIILGVPPFSPKSSLNRRYLEQKHWDDSVQYTASREAAPWLIHDCQLIVHYQSFGSREGSGSTR